jgi:hypothetical protein
MVLVVCGAIAGTLYALWRPHWVFVLIVVMFPLKQLLQVSVPLVNSRPLIFNFTVGLLALFAVMTRFGRRVPLGAGYNNGATTFTICLYLLWWIGLLWTPAKHIVFDQIYTHLSYQFLLLIVLPLLVLDLKEFRRMTTGLMVIGTIIAILIMVNPRSSFYGGRLRLDLGMLGYRTAGSPLSLAEMGGFMAIIAVLIVPTAKSGLYTFLRVAAFVSGLGLAIGSGSRGQVLAAGVVGVLFFPMARKLSNPRQFFASAIAFALVVGGLFLVFNLFVASHNRERWDLTQMLQDTLLRFDMVGELAGAYMASPAHWLLGLGTGAYAVISKDIYTTYCHNVIADAAFEHGIVGFTFFALATYFTFKYGRRMWQLHRDDPEMRSAATLLLAGAAYNLLMSVKQGSLAYPQPLFWFVVMTKIACYELKTAEEHKTELAEMDLPEFSDEPDDGGYQSHPGQPALGY